MFNLQHTKLNSFALSISSKNLLPWCSEVMVLRNGMAQYRACRARKRTPVRWSGIQRSAVRGQRWWWPHLLKLASLVSFVAFFVCPDNLVFRVRVAVGVFYLNMSKKGKKQDGTISPFLLAINHRKSCSKRHLKNITLLNIDLCACACVRVCVLRITKL